MSRKIFIAARQKRNRAGRDSGENLADLFLSATMIRKERVKWVRSAMNTLKQAGEYLRRLGRRTPLDSGAPADLWEAAYPAGVDWQFSEKPRPLYTLLDDAVSAYAKRTCLKFQGKEYSYGKVGELAGKAAAGLRELGVERGVKVGLFLPNSPYYVIAYYAILKAGGTVVNFNPLYAEPEIARQIVDSETAIMFTLDLQSLYPKVARQLDRTCLRGIIVCPMSGVLKFPQNYLFDWLRRKEIAAIPADERHVPFRRLIKNAGTSEPADIDAEREVAVLQYTGGVTGTLKGAMLTHANLYSNALQLKQFATWVKPGSETCFVPVPLCHAFGMNVMNFALCTGAKLVLPPQFRIADAFNAVQRERCTLLFGVPTIYSALSAYREARRYDLSSLRICISGGAPLAPEVKNAFESLVGCAVIDGYGLTEASPVCTLVPPGVSHKPGTVGLPLPGTVIEIRSLTHPSRVLPPGELGEICVRGPQVMAGYWKQPGETATVLRDGLLRTGDFGCLDTEGYLFIVDRIKEMIISGGFNVYPRMVEETIRLHPAIVEAIICGLPDHRRGERVKAYVRLHRDFKLTAAELRAFLKDKLAPFEMPNEIEILQEFPRELLRRPPRKELLVRKFAKKRRAVLWNPLRRLSDLLRRCRLAFRPSVAQRS